MNCQYHADSDCDELERKLNSTLQEISMNNCYQSDSNDSLDSEDSLDDNVINNTPYNFDYRIKLNIKNY